MLMKILFEVGDCVITTINHSTIRHTIFVGTKVKVTEVDPELGYSIADEEGNEIIYIGWVI